MKCKTMKHGNIGLQCMMLAFIFAVCFVIRTFLTF